MKFLYIAFVLVLVGCSSGPTVVNVESTVSRFYEEDRFLQGASFKFMPSKEQQGSLEYKNYARMIAKKLKLFGMSEVIGSDADYGVVFTYGVDFGKDVVSQKPIMGQTGGGTTYHTGTVYTGGAYGNYNSTSYTTPIYGVVGVRTNVRQEYTRFINLDLIDLNMSTESNLIKIYEAKLKSVGSSSTFLEVSQCLVDTLFTDFYSNNGSIQRLVVNGDLCMKNVKS